MAHRNRLPPQIDWRWSSPPSPALDHERARPPKTPAATQPPRGGVRRIRPFPEIALKGASDAGEACAGTRQDVVTALAKSIEPTPESPPSISPSAFMRQLRPELYSDSADRTVYQLDALTLAFHLSTITDRNETHGFEIFCRKLCSRAVCPNLLPMTGPEGGGDSKADTETFPVARSIARLWYVGSDAAQESWAFAFSAKKTWSTKVRSDVAGIVATGRGYTRIYFVTSRSARSKDRARVRDELRSQYGVDVIIFDRSWIVEQVIDEDRRDLAFHYLGVGREITSAHRLGPNDYSRTQQLDDLERLLKDHAAFEHMPMQRVTEALVAAKLSRNLERPRIETDGRFARAIRLAEADGNFRQRLAAQYERIWTNYWWFDDTDGLLRDYDAFEALALPSDHLGNLAPLLDLLQLLYNGVVFRHFTIDAARLDERVARVRAKLEPLAADPARPNNALEARASLLLIDLNEAFRTHDSAAQGRLWPQFSQVLQCARGLGEFNAERWVRLIEVFGDLAAADPGYAQLVDDLAEFVAARSSEGQGALVLLRQAARLRMERPLEIIRLCGKAAYQLTKREYAEELVEALQLLGVAYRQVGLWWAARASLLTALATIAIEGDNQDEMPITVIGTTVILASIALELRHLPDALDALRLLRGCEKGMGLDAPSQAMLREQMRDFDVQLASLLVNLKPDGLAQAEALPDVLAGLKLPGAQAALMYTLGYETKMRAEGWLSSHHTPEFLADMHARLAGQPFADPEHGPVLFYGREPGWLFTRVMGITVEVHHSGSDVGVATAEAVIGSIEAVFATALSLEVHPHTERLRVVVEESTSAEQPHFDVDRLELAATLYWPPGWALDLLYQQPVVREVLMELAVTLLHTSCLIRDPHSTLSSLADEDVMDARLMMVVVAGNSRRRVFHSDVGRVADWATIAGITRWPLMDSAPRIVRKAPSDEAVLGPERPVSTSQRDVHSHRALGVRSVTDLALWDKAGWTGTGFLDYGPRHPPVLALLFTDTEAARRIFSRWRERFGTEDRDEVIYLSMIRGVSAEHSAHYRFLVTASPGGGAEVLTISARFMTMQAQSDAHWQAFEARLRQHSMFWLVPGIVRPGEAPDFLTELAILKRKLHVRQAADVKPGDVEWVARVRPPVA